MRAERVLKISHTGLALQAPVVAPHMEATLDRPHVSSDTSASNHERSSPMEHI